MFSTGSKPAYATLDTTSSTGVVLDVRLVATLCRHLHFQQMCVFLVILALLPLVQGCHPVSLALLGLFPTPQARRSVLHALLGVTKTSQMARPVSCAMLDPSRIQLRRRTAWRALLAPISSTTGGQHAMAVALCSLAILVSQLARSVISWCHLYLGAQLALLHPLFQPTRTISG